MIYLKSLNFKSFLHSNRHFLFQPAVPVHSLNESEMAATAMPHQGWPTQIKEETRFAGQADIVMKVSRRAG